MIGRQGDMQATHSSHAIIALHKTATVFYKIVQQQAKAYRNSTDRFSSSQRSLMRPAPPPPKWPAYPNDAHRTSSPGGRYSFQPTPHILEAPQSGISCTHLRHNS